MPNSLASRAVRRGEVNINSFAFASPTKRGKNHDEPKSPLAPTLAKAVITIARSAAMRRSAASAIESPAPAAAPGNAAITGWGNARNAALTVFWRERSPSIRSSTLVL
ncbi:unannotated protein [freshwater metagenome]|uniref:Unannotated protein n=1 Tax=freshwater metagenome TaxID=449393 RepID=A0A6J6LHC9_9ZZZZ